ncbi:MAG: helix-turn-helix domain-containing protein, partial [Bdellovibrionales bacterium]
SQFFPKFGFSELRPNFPNVRIFNPKHSEREVFMDNAGVIIQHLRTLAGLSVRETAKKINRSVGWLSEIENSQGTARISEIEFNRIVETLGGSKHRALFKTWVANAKNRERLDKSFDGAVLKFIRIKKGLSLDKACELTKLSASYLSKLENGHKPVTLEMRNRIMQGYGYSPSSFKNLATDPVRSKAVTLRYKLEILLNELETEKIASVFEFVRNIVALAEPTKQHSNK